MCKRTTLSEDTSDFGELPSVSSYRVSTHFLEGMIWISLFYVKTFIIPSERSVCEAELANINLHETFSYCNSFRLFPQAWFQAS